MAAGREQFKGYYSNYGYVFFIRGKRQLAATEEEAKEIFNEFYDKREIHEAKEYKHKKKYVQQKWDF